MSFFSSLHCSNSESKAKYGDLKFKFNVFDNLKFIEKFCKDMDILESVL